MISYYYLNIKLAGKVQTIAKSTDWEELQRWCVVYQYVSKDYINSWVAAEPRGKQLYERIDAG